MRHQVSIVKTFFLSVAIFTRVVDGNFSYNFHPQGLKLSASGQEIGGASCSPSLVHSPILVGEMLFARRIGFSGTPNDLLPLVPITLILSCTSIFKFGSILGAGQVRFRTRI
jgi:hypothetical protein